MPKEKKAHLSLQKIFLIFFCLVIVFVIFQIRKAHRQLPEMLRTAVESLELEKQGLKLDFAKASFTLVGSLSHPFGLRLKNVKLIKKESCKVHELAVETLVIPVKILPFYHERKLNIGVVRFSESKLLTKEVCSSSTLKAIRKKTRNKKLIKNSKTVLERSFLGLLKKMRVLHFNLLKYAEFDVTVAGALAYETSISIGGAQLELERLKVLLGAGAVKYKAEWRGKVSTAAFNPFLKGSLVGLKDQSDLSLALREKESLVELNLISKTRPNEEARCLVSISALPLSLIKNVKSSSLSDLNLRKTWLDSGVEIETADNTINLKVLDFKIYGDFGLVETGANKPHFVWTEGERKWSLAESTQLKFKDIEFVEVLADEPKKKMSEIFKDFGKFNAMINLKSLDEFKGDFETNNFSISLRSRGRKAYQDIKFARGSLRYQKEKNLSFQLQEVALENGDFEGSVELSYNYEKKHLETQFKVENMSFDPQLTQKILAVDEGFSFSLNGSGHIAKSKIVGTKKELYQNALNFKLQTEGLKTRHWSVSDAQARCGLKEKSLNCKLRLGSLDFSKDVKSRLALEKAQYKDVKSLYFNYENKLLTSSLKAGKNRFNFNWSADEGVRLSEPGSKEIWLRGL